MVKLRWLMTPVAAAVLGAGVLAGTGYAGGTSVDPATKASIADQMEQAQRLEAASTPQAPKIDTGVESGSCPQATPTHAILSFSGGPFPGGANMVDTTSLVDLQNGGIDQIYAGATDSNTLLGQVIVWNTPADPCAPGAVYDGTVSRYLDSDQNGALQIVGVVGDTILLKAANGQQEAFDTVTRKLGPLVPTP